MKEKCYFLKIKNIMSNINSLHAGNFHAFFSSADFFQN